LVSITESGNNVLQEVEEMAVSRASGLLELLSPKDLQNLKTGLESLQRVMSEHLGPDFEEDLIALKAKAREKYETS
jgi:DNA-binding MarR family transcriptional regulator